jgi:hypothetical protein
MTPAPSSAASCNCPLNFVLCVSYNCGGERGPVTFPAFKAGDSVLRGSNGGFDFHTPPPFSCSVYAGACDLLLSVQRGFSEEIACLGSRLRHCYRSGRIGLCGERPTEEAEVASFAAKRPDENHGQNSSFNDPFARRSMDSFTAAPRATQHQDPPKMTPEFPVNPAARKHPLSVSF